MSNPIPLIARVLLLAFLAIAALTSPLVWGAEPIRIGVLAFRPKPQTLSQWQPLAVALKRAIPGRDFVLEALTFPEMEAAVSSRQLDFVLTNPGHYVLLTKRSGLSAPLATLVADDKGQHVPVFGGVMFALASQAGINTLQDIEGKTVAITSTDSLAGYQMQAFEMSRADLRLPQGDTLVVTGMPHDKVVEAVLAGRAEVGFVRTGVLEAMVLEDALDPKQVKVLHRQTPPGFAQQVSTRLYPEWTFAALAHIDADLAKQVTAALFLLEENTATTRAIGIHGFSVPADYTPVAELLKELRLPPFDTAPRFTLQDVWARYHGPLVGAFLALGLILLLGLRLLWVNRRLKTERHRVLQQKAQLQDSEERYRVLVEWSPEAILVHRMGTVLFVNAAAIELFGATTASALLGKSTSELIHPDYLEVQAARMKSINDRVAIVPMVESKFLKLDGTAIDVQVQGTSIVYDGHQAIHVSIRDITERKHAEAQLHLAASVFTFAREAIMITAADGSVIDVNEAFSRITGYSREDMLGKNPRLLASGRQSSDFYADVWRDLEENGHWFGEMWNRHKDGEVYAVMQTISAVRGASGAVQHYVALFSDITAIKEQQLQLEHIAHYDPLTNLPNRVLMADRMRQGMAQAQRRGQSVAVAYLDLDGFKAINDHHGHEAGDQLLIALAARMKQALREGDTLARIGGDEFVAVLVDLVDVSASVPMLTRLLTAAAEPVQLGALTLQVSASLGVTFYPQAEDMDADQLLRQADQAMYQAKLAGKNRYHVFDAEQDRNVRGHHESQERIHHALTQGELVLYYQPKVNMRTGKVIGAEALIRWQHPEQGLLPPAAFLPVIEDHPLAVDIGEWVINTALTQMETWHAGGLDIPVSVNVGARQLQQPNFVDRLRAILAAHPGIQPSCLELEVLETSALEDVAGVSRVIETCRDMGVMFALDDFGTGYSSLTYLKRLPASLLKIDQSFVRDMLDDPDDLAILEGVIGLATAFRRDVIAEGVETLEHGAMLLQLGCDQAQGYGIARPMPAHQMPAWCVAWRPDAAWGNVPLVNRDDLPLLFASVEHRAWIRAVEGCLMGAHAVAPSMDHEQCHFGTWLKGPGLVRHGAHSSFAQVDVLHRQAHDLAIELCALRAAGANQQAVARLGELRALGDALLEQVYGLMHTSGLEKNSIYQEEVT